MKRVTIIKWLRIIHRDLGYFMVGISMVYAISGIYLNHMKDSDPAFVTVEESIQMQDQLSLNDFEAAWNKLGITPIRNQMAIDSSHCRLMLEGGIGIYNKATGIVDYELHRRKEFVYWINRLHYSRVAGWNIMADIFATSLIFFAISGLFMIRGKKGLLGRGKYFVIIGILIPILYIIFA